MPELKFDKLTDGNYLEWKIYMEALLTRKSLFNVVDGSERHPGGREGTKPVKDFYRRQSEARSEIILRVEPAQLVHCRDNDPYTIWTTLANVHLSRGRATILALRRRFYRLRFDRDETISAYISRARYLAFLLEETGVIISDDDLMLAITAGLPHSYDHFLISLDTLIDSEYTLNNIITRLNNEYERQHMYSTNPRPNLNKAQNPSDEALSAMSLSKPRVALANITCFNCGEKGHYQNNCPRPKLVMKAHQERAQMAEETSDNDFEGVF